MNTKFFTLVALLLVASISYAQDKTVIPKHTPKPATVCARSNIDTLEFTHNKEFRPAQCRIEAHQLSVTLTKHFYQAFPERALKDDINVVFELQIEADGTVSSVSILRSQLKSEENDKLRELVSTVISDNWIPASYKGNKISSSHTLPVILLAKVNDI
ncbi:MAG: hypothetical protein LBI73_05955 [Myroides sp.]|jgi:hypothetical protein|nr:hypothetical protein [Myroides sp.]